MATYTFSNALERVQGSNQLLLDSVALQKRAFNELMMVTDFKDIYLSLQVQGRKRAMKPYRKAVVAKKPNVMVRFSKKLYQETLRIFLLSKRGLIEKICDDYKYCEKVVKHGKSLAIVMALADLGTTWAVGLPWVTLAWALLKEGTLDDMCDCNKKLKLLLEKTS